MEEECEDAVGGGLKKCGWLWMREEEEDEDDEEVGSVCLGAVQVAEASAVV